MYKEAYPESGIRKRPPSPKTSCRAIWSRRAEDLKICWRKSPAGVLIRRLVMSSTPSQPMSRKSAKHSERFLVHARAAILRPRPHRRPQHGPTSRITQTVPPSLPLCCGPKAEGYSFECSLPLETVRPTVLSPLHPLSAVLSLRFLRLVRRHPSSTRLRSSQRGGV